MTIISQIFVCTLTGLLGFLVGYAFGLSDLLNELDLLEISRTFFEKRKKSIESEEKDHERDRKNTQ